MKLIRGKGSPELGACWMSAVHYYTSAGTKNFIWSDYPDFVSIIIRDLCVILNDDVPDQQREELIGPHIFAPAGTAKIKNSDNLERQLALVVADHALRIWLPRYFEKENKNEAAKVLRNFPPLTKENKDSIVEKAEEISKEFIGLVASDIAKKIRIITNDSEGIEDVFKESRRLVMIIMMEHILRHQDLLDLILKLCAIAHKECDPIIPSRTPEQTIKEVCK